MNSLLTNKYVMVVGGSSGMGAATARALSEQGAHIVLVARNNDRLQQVAKQLKTDVVTIAGDITQPEDRQKIADSSPEISHIVFTAADLSYLPFDTVDQAAMDRSIGSKVTGPFFLLQLLTSKVNELESVTFITGVAAERPIAGGTITGMVNGAINSMIRGLTLELSPTRVNAVSPGWVDTPFWDRIASKEQKDSRFNAMREKLPSHHITTSDNIASAVSSVISNPAINASIMYVDSAQRLV